MLSQTRVSGSNLTVVPKAVRKSLGVKRGDILEWSIQRGRIVIEVRKRVGWDDIAGLISVGGDAVRDKKRAQRGEL